jgi:hypothetical protein
MRKRVPYNELTARAFHAQATKFAETQGQAVCAVFEDDARGGMEVVGSAVLFGVGSARFAISAGHVFLRLRKNPQILAVPGKGLIHLMNRAYTFTATSPDSEKYDLAFIKLSQQEVEDLGDCDIVSLADVDMLERADYVSPWRSKYWVVGFPCRSQKKGKPAGSQVMRTLPAAKETYTKLGISELTHLVLKWDRKKAHSLGGPITGAKLHGMSGGGIWTAPPSGNSPLLRQRFLGILTEHHEGSLKTIVGTRIGSVLSGIFDEFPELERELRASASPSPIEPTLLTGWHPAGHVSEACLLCKFIGSAAMQSWDGTTGFVVFVRVTNDGKPTTLKSWKATLLIGNRRIELSNEYLPLDGPSLPVPGLSLPLAPRGSLALQTLAAPVGPSSVTGYILATTKDLKVATLGAHTVQAELTCEDESGTIWTFKSPLDNPDHRAPILSSWPGVNV